MDRKDWQERSERSLKEWGARIDDFRHRARGRYDDEVQLLRDKYEVASRRLKELKETGGDAWEGVKGGFESALSELKKSLDNAKSRFKH